MKTRGDGNCDMNQDSDPWDELFSSTSASLLKRKREKEKGKDKKSCPETSFRVETPTQQVIHEARQDEISNLKNPEKAPKPSLQLKPHHHP